MEGRIVVFTGFSPAVGKTSICWALAGALANRGRRVLLIDAAVDGSLTKMAGLSPGREPGLTELALWQREPHRFKEVSGRGRLPDGVGLIPSPRNQRLHSELRRVLGPRHPAIALMAPFRKLRRDWELVLVDTSHDISDPLTFITLCAATDVLTVVDPSRLADAAEAQQDVALVRDDANAFLEALGIIVAKARQVGRDEERVRQWLQTQGLDDAVLDPAFPYEPVSNQRTRLSSAEASCALAALADYVESTTCGVRAT